MSPARALGVAALATALVAGAAGARAASAAALNAYCDRPTPMTAAAQDRLLRFADVVRRELDASGHDVALVARSGIDLSRFRQRYSHAGVSLRRGAGAPWSVRQLYYACDERRPRLYDQGLAGFVLGADDPALGHVSIVLLPAGAAGALERAALDTPRALRLVQGAYSANAYPFAPRYVNCNQWVAELLAAAWGALDDGPDLRSRAQRWLREAGYQPTTIDVGSHALMLAGTVVPWVHYDDQPEDDRWALRFRVSMPASIEAFARAQVPGAERIELCQADTRVVVHRGWDAVADGCVPGAGDRVVTLD